MQPGRASPRRSVRRIDGVLLLNKSRGLSSNAALQRVKRFYQAESAGHTGTLDPLASGLLPICLGDATKFGGELLESDKRYTAVVRLGETTATGDAEGPVLEKKPADISREQLEAVLGQFRGGIFQTPPMYSALKHHGQPLYELARKGETVEREPRQVLIRSLELLDFAPPLATLDVLCSKGTYIRTLAEDLGAALHCGAHLAQLERTEVGPYGLRDSIGLDALEAMSTAERDELLRPVDTLVRKWPSLTLTQACAVRFTFGQAISRADLLAGDAAWGVAESGARVRVYAPSGAFLGMGFADPDGSLRPKRLVSSAGSS